VDVGVTVDVEAEGVRVGKMKLQEENRISIKNKPITRSRFFRFIVIFQKKKLSEVCTSLNSKPEKLIISYFS